jgi:hypothetical protein
MNTPRHQRIGLAGVAALVLSSLYPHWCRHCVPSHGCGSPSAFRPCSPTPPSIPVVFENGQKARAAGAPAGPSANAPRAPAARPA